MKVLNVGTKVMLTGTITCIRTDGDGDVIYDINIDGDRHLPIYVSQEAVKVAPWFGDDGK